MLSVVFAEHLCAIRKETPWSPRAELLEMLTILIMVMPNLTLNGLMNIFLNGTVLGHSKDNKGVLILDFDEFAQRVAMGEEFQFYYKNEGYWISRNNESFYLTRVQDSSSQTFKTSEDLFKEGRIENKTIHELWEELEV
ncbi:hypothetical protein SAMN04489762_2407 [Terribacillus saccharophilus]|uniref:Uncharacterized protein n=1 Tax=Terribacillus saccharophilus TaxID=361277 RepID=A0AAX2EGY0_9BACI|nr:hypothetical protein SAMN04489762_2407 [Terribacillus saccharophilus]